MTSGDAYRWRLRLLASVDLVGSTMFKQSPARHDSPLGWRKARLDFHRHLPRALAECHLKLGGSEAGWPLRVWKYNGDEILFETELTDHRQALAHIAALVELVATFGDWVVRAGVDPEPFPLVLKATAWLAGFPATNHEVRVGDQPEGSGGPRDFIGPQIDLGFRLARHAARRRLVVDACLAEMLLTAAGDDQAPHLHYGGRAVLPGVLGDQPYPMVWCDVPWEATRLEEAVAPPAAPPNPADLVAFLRQYIDITPGLYRPFIEGDQVYCFDTSRHSELEIARQRLIEWDPFGAQPISGRPDSAVGRGEVDQSIHDAPR